MTNEGQNAKFPKREKLTGKKQIEELFRNGSSFYLSPLLLKYSRDEGDYHRVLCTVSKKNFKRAVDRNLIKRRLREAYRLNKSIIDPTKSGIAYQIAIIYTGKSDAPYHTIEGKLKELLLRLQDQT